MANSEFAMEEQEKQNLLETINDLESILDEKEEELDALNTEILELQKEVNKFRNGIRQNDNINRELVSFQAQLLNIVRGMDGITEQDFLRYAHHFVHNLRSQLESSQYVRLECERQNTPVYSVHSRTFKLPGF